MIKHFLFLVLSISLILHLQAQNNRYNLRVVAHYDDANIQPIDGDQVWSDVTGWKDTVKNREYMIAGSTDSLYFFDVTTPLNMKKCDVEAGRSRNAINRDYEIYGHYVYCVSDRTSPLGSLEIFDLQYLPDSVHKVYDNDTFSINTHTIFIEQASQRMYLCGNIHKPAGSWSMGIFSLANPEEPAFLGELDKNQGCPYTHEVFVQRDTAYCSCGNSGLFIYDLRNPQQTVLLGSIVAPYPGNGYNHSSWLDSTGKYLMFTDENQGSPIKVYDLEHINAPDLVTYFNSNTQALPHNAYWKGRFAYASSYEDGVYIYDMQNIPTQTPSIAAFYDTYPKNATGIYNGFHGCWGVWPFLPSGLILASDISEGLFVLETTWPLGTEDAQQGILKTSFYPNPFTEKVTVSIQSVTAEHAEISMYDLQGKRWLQQSILLQSGSNIIDLKNVNGLPEGLYQATIVSEHSFINQPLLKIN
ncbi:MAG: choice-of-anchor B family protein [Bacteroidota bacterium]